MTMFAKIDNGVVVQCQPYEEDGFISAPANVVCGMLWDGEAFTAPAVPLSIEDYRVAIQSHVDTAARSKNYGDGNACASYFSSTNPQWAAEAAAFIGWRDNVWLYTFSELEKVQNGQREAPTVPTFLGELPAVNWPAE